MNNPKSPAAKLLEFENPVGSYELVIHHAALAILRNYPFDHQQFSYMTQWEGGATIWRAEALGFVLTVRYAPTSQELDIEKHSLAVTEPLGVAH